MKKIANENSSKVAELAENIVKESADPLRTAVKCAIIGN
jgi:uncharacterized protein with ATP-grasp and redox domains